MSRRGFVAGGAVAAGAAGMALAGVAGAEEAAQVGGAAGDYQVDLLVVGEGMGGLCAAMQALESGVQSVMIVEASRWIGGGSSFSVGSIHVGSAGMTGESLLGFTEGLATAPMSTAVIEQVPELQTWLRDDLALPVSIEEGEKTEAESLSTFSGDAPRGHMLDPDGMSGIMACANFFQAFETAFVERGGQVLHGVAARHILQDADKTAITGVQCVEIATGNPVRVQTSQVILACGGFQDDTELKQRYLGVDGRYAANMGSPYNTGAGIKLAQEVGASLQGDMSHFAGLFMPAYPARNFLEDVTSYEEHGYDEEEEGKWWVWHYIIDNYPTKSILVNSDGVRFCDEDTPGHSSEPFIAQQRFATAVVIADSTGWDEWAQTYGRGASVITLGDKVEASISDKVGGRLYTADTIEELADQMNASGIASHQINKANLLATIEEYNAAAEAGTPEALSPSRTAGECVSIATPPFYAFPIRNAIFITFGGVAVNDRCQVLDATHVPIAGLYAASPTAGGFMEVYYCGSIAHAGVTGRWAAQAAAEALGVSAPAASDSAASEAAA